MAKLPDAARAKLQAANIAYLAELMEDGSPHVTPVWVDVEDNTILVNSAEGRVKTRNIRRDPRVALTVPDKENPYEKVDIRGRVVEIVDDQRAFDHIDKLAMKYMGQEKYPWLQPGEQRVMFRIEPKVVHVGP